LPGNRFATSSTSKLDINKRRMTVLSEKDHTEVTLVDPSVAKRWDAQAAGAAEKEYPVIDLVRLERWFFKGETGRVLDYGIGAGVNTIHLARRGYVVDALDASAEMVKVAQNRVDGYPEISDRITINHISPNAQSLPYDDESFDYIVCVNVISLLGSRERVLLLMSEFKRILKPGGRIIVDVNAQGADFSRNSKKVAEDTYLYKGVSGTEEGILTYCPDSAEKFAEIVGSYFDVDDVGFTSFKYLHSAITEYIVCAHKP